jgi:ligand-binding sensor domain-containing protein
MGIAYDSVSGSQKRMAMVLVALMLLLPWSSFESTNLDENSDFMSTISGAWGAGGSNDTGWIELSAEGANPSNGTYAYGDLFLDFAPGALIDNMTFEVKVNGSDGLWAYEPQITLLDTQTPILDWTELGGFGMQNSFSENQPDVNSAGILDTRLQPNSVSDTSWQLPTGISITDLVMEALRPADPKVSFSSLDIEIFDSAVNPVDGRLYILLGDDLLHLDDQTSTIIVDIESDVYGRSLAVDETRNRLLIGTSNGSILQRSLSDSSIMETSLITDESGKTFDAITVDDYGTVWATSGCDVYYTSDGSWESYYYCPGGAIKTATDIVSTGNDVYISTYQGLHVLGFSTSSGVNGTLVSVDSNVLWNTGNFLSSDKINDLQLLGSQLLIATENAGIDRRNLASNSWMATWSTSNWLSSNQVIGFGLTEGWLYILAANTVHTYDTNALFFSSQRQLTVFDLKENGNEIISWPNLGKARSPDSGLVLVGDGSGVLGRLVGEINDGTETLVSSPSTNQMNQVIFVDDYEEGEIWVSGGTIIDRFDEATQTWLSPIDISDYVSNPFQITSFVQDSDGWVWVGTINSGILRLDNTDASYMGTVQGIASNAVSSLSHDSYTEILVVGHYEDGLSFVNTSSMTLSDVITEQDGLDSDFINDVVTRYGVAYIATPDAGVMRINLQELSILSSWQSLGADNLEAAPIAVDQDIIYFGLTGFGILLIDRHTSEIIDIWDADGSSGLPDNDVLSLHLDYYGGLIIGMEVPNSGGTSNQAMARWDGSNWEYFETDVPGGNNDPFKINDIKSDADGVVAATNRGVCTWTGWTIIQGNIYEWDECVSPMNNSARFSETFSIELVPLSSPLSENCCTRILAGHDEGASLINRNTGLTVVERWTAGDDTQRARVVKVQDILYIGFENTGIGRYNLTSQEWLQTWDGDQGYINDDDVTVLIPGHIENTIWAGGDFGLTLIDVVNDTVLIDWNRGSNSGGPTLSNSAPQDVIIVDDILHYSTQRSTAWWQSSDQIWRINLTSNSSESTIDVGQELGWNGKIHSLGQVSEELWIGIRPTQYWNDGDGTIARWNVTNETWETPLDTIGSVLRVNTQFLGECFPINVSSCELWIAYGDNILRRFSAQTMTLLNEWTDIPGPIRGIVEYQDDYLFASMDGILRWEPDNETWLDPWVVNDGLPSDANDELYTMIVVGDDLMGRKF